MSDLISRDALIAQYSHPNELVYTFDIIDRIKGAPVVDAAPVVRGRWIKSEVEDEILGALEYWDCSECGCTDLRHGTSNYCAQCGADMRGDNNG